MIHSLPDIAKAAAAKIATAAMHDKSMTRRSASQALRFERSSDRVVDDRAKRLSPDVEAFYAILWVYCECAIPKLADTVAVCVFRIPIVLRRVFAISVRQVLPAPDEATILSCDIYSSPVDFDQV